MNTLARYSFVLSAALVVTSCSVGPVGQRTASPAASTASTEMPAPSQTPAPSLLASPEPTPTDSEPIGDEPPDGTLRGNGADVAGKLGSYCYGDTCADIGEWPKKSDLPAVGASGQNQEMKFTLPESVRFVEWYASYSPSSNEDVVDLAGAGSGYDPDATYASPWAKASSVTFGSPPEGDWVVYVSVYFDGGDLSYAWHVIVQ